MATIFDPQNFSTSFLTGSVNDYNSLTDEQRSQYTDMTNFTPLQTDPANFSTTMQDPGFVKYMTAPVAKAAKGPTVTIQGTPSTTKVPSAEELMARMEAGQPMIRQGEELPTYDPRSGESPGEFWSQYPSFAYAGEGLRGTIYGLSNSQLQEIEEAPNVQATPVQQQRQTGRPLFQPGGHPGTPEGSLAASQDRINQMSLENLSIHHQFTDLLGLPRARPKNPQGVGQTGISAVTGQAAAAAASPTGAEGIQGVQGPAPAPPSAPAGTPTGEGGIGVSVGFCFVTGTKMTMGDGSKIEVENVKLLDELLGSDRKINTVIEVHHKLLGNRKIVSINGSKFFCTEDHPFKTKNGWQAVNSIMCTELYPDLDILNTDLAIGDTVETEDGDIIVEKIDTKEVPVDTQIWNFVMNNDHTYVAEGFVMHNKKEGGRVHSFINN